MAIDEVVRTPSRRQVSLGVIALMVGLVVALMLFTGLAVNAWTRHHPPSPVDVSNVQNALDHIGAPVADLAEPDEDVVRWLCPERRCAFIAKEFIPTDDLALGQAVPQIEAWAAEAGLRDGGPISCDTSLPENVSFVPFGQCVGEWLTPDGTEVFMSIRLADPVAYRASGSLIGALWTDHADAKVAAIWTYGFASFEEED